MARPLLSNSFVCFNSLILREERDGGRDRGERLREREKGEMKEERKERDGGRDRQRMRWRER